MSRKNKRDPQASITALGTVVQNGRRGTLGTGIESEALKEVSCGRKDRASISRIGLNGSFDIVISYVIRQLRYYLPTDLRGKGET